VAIYLLQLLFFIWMGRLNRTHIRRHCNDVPGPFQGLIDGDKLSEINRYTLENSGLSLIRKVVFDTVLLGLILSGSLTFLDALSTDLLLRYLMAGTLFFVTIAMVFFILDLPFDYYHTFVIEEKYGFNRSSLGIWVTDNLKQCLLSMVLLLVLVVPVLWTIRVSPDYWWFWGFAVVSVGQLCLTLLYPILIAPLFNKFEPLEDRILVDRVENLIAEAGVKSGGIFQMDAGRRSRHSNAYFAGLGGTRRIVLFDTLIDSHNHDEILAVLAHELGHFKRKHVFKSYILALSGTFAAFYLTYLLLGWEPLYETFGLDPARPYPALLIIGVFWQRLGFFLTPFFAALSRRFEREADAIAATLLQTPTPLIEALKRMACDNLANLNPHPFYVWFNYSHPPMLERINRLEETAPTAGKSRDAA